LQQRLPGAQILDRLPLPVLQNFMAAVDLVIAMDSLPLHLAATTSTATYGFFGPSLGLKYQPQGPQHHAFQGCCPYGQIFAKRCPALRTCPTGACLREANGEQLFKQFAAAYRRALIEPVQTELSPPS
jgi:heptosyltransferase-1